MIRRGVWVRSAFDLVFLVLGSVLVISEGFERALAHSRIELPNAPGPDGRISEDVRAFVIGLDRSGALSVAGEACSIERVRELATAAQARGDREAVVLADARGSVEALYRLFAELRQARFLPIRLAVQPEEGR